MMVGRSMFQPGTVLIRRYLCHDVVDRVVRSVVSATVGAPRDEVHRDLHVGDGGYVAEYRVGLVGETGEPVVVVAGIRGVGTLVVCKPPFAHVSKHLMGLAVRG